MPRCEECETFTRDGPVCAACWDPHWHGGAPRHEPGEQEVWEQLVREAAIALRREPPVVETRDKDPPEEMLNELWDESQPNSRCTVLEGAASPDGAVRAQALLDISNFCPRTPGDPRNMFVLTWYLDDKIRLLMIRAMKDSEAEVRSAAFSTMAFLTRDARTDCKEEVWMNGDVRAATMDAIKGLSSDGTEFGCKDAALQLIACLAVDCPWNAELMWRDVRLRNSLTLWNCFRPAAQDALHAIRS
mmetsp:Transcript_105152/g.279864  ORF Transcript_105152/g.279864 Transcript_105152/m.279864 type:complete len:245 (-) Transcript_105152:28-762(-)|eukprot:CAMPEP_0171195292 /NCGR_PEP_ID=MMETSP0790-20130122/21323_1 /TAXON_ID=2925 /ORGANISM="Alexandrium catenella, Strain OF101" /LENGTH=244 /DNA_ID=CAMNT_0011660503 /DNA_START=43 /DNA_END=777 /DNA_ORIENTATION=+